MPRRRRRQADNLCAALACGAVLLILILVFVFVLRQLVPPGDLQWLHHSLLMPHLDMLAQWAQALFSQFEAGQATGIST